MIGSEDIIWFYESFYQKKYGNVKYKFTPSEKASQEIEQFLSVLEKRHKLITLGNSYLSRYFTFQFKRLEGQVFKRFSSKDKSGKIQIYDVIGKKAISYWESRDTEFDFIIERKISRLYTIDNSQYNKAEDIEKKRFYNTDKGLVNCIEKTSLFNHRSSICILCTHKIDCKILLKENHKHIYIARGYDTTT
jgi:hypothetical protein